MKALAILILLPGLALAAAQPPDDWPYKTMDVPGGRVMDCEEKATLRRNGVNLTYSAHIEPKWVRLVDLPDRFIVINEADQSVMVSGFIPEMDPIDISSISNVVYFPVQVSEPLGDSLMARTTGNDYGIFYLLREDINLSWTCRMLPQGASLIRE